MLVPKITVEDYGRGFEQPSLGMKSEVDCPRKKCHKYRPTGGLDVASVELRGVTSQKYVQVTLAWCIHVVMSDLIAIFPKFLG